MRKLVYISALIAVGFMASPALAAGGAAFPPFDSKTFAGQLFWLTLTFGALYWLMSTLALPRVAAILDERRETIASALSEAAKAQKQAEDAALAHEQSLAKAKADGQRIAQEAHSKSAKQIETKRVKVEAENAAKLAEAESRITAMKDEAMGNVSAIAQDAVSAIIEQISGKPPTAKTVTDAIQSVSEAR